ncbi:TPA: M20/M25/M40 family metallo-hydrolase [Candidatus Bathyarchaeota archaeon]|nr:M20/M25/M40 family metallo-hydrolase [Candidatus Bathyarchaeota archaeon]
MMKLKDSVGLLRRMLEIYSPSGKEEQIASFIEEEFGLLGFEAVRRDKAGNIYGEVGSGFYSILLCGHMDTVPGWIPVKRKDDRLYGRGAVDAKSSLAAMISAADMLRSKLQDQGKIIVAGVVDEEGKARGIRQLLREDLKAECAIFGEPSGLRNITFAYKGRVSLRIVCETRTGHVGAQHLFDNAVEVAFDLWRCLKDRCGEYRSPHGLFYSLSPSLMKINSQRTTGGVPDKCLLEIDLRLPPKFSSERAIQIVKETVENFLEEKSSISISLQVKDRVEPFVARRDTIVMESLKEAILEITGEHAKFLRKTGTGDMNIFGVDRKIPVVTYGPGDARLSHTRREYIEIPEYLASIQVYKRTVEKILSKIQDSF